MSVTRMKPPTWFWIAGVLLLLWELMGVWSFYEHTMNGPNAMGAQATDYDRALFASLPGWYSFVFGVATLGGLFAVIALLRRHSSAVGLAGISLAATVLMFGWMFLATDIIAVKGVWTTYFPAVIIILGVLTLWFASSAKARGWIG